MRRRLGGGAEEEEEEEEDEVVDAGSLRTRSRVRAASVSGHDGIMDHGGK